MSGIKSLLTTRYKISTKFYICSQIYLNLLLTKLELIKTLFLNKIKAEFQY